MKNKEAVQHPALPEKTILLPDTELSIAGFHKAIVNDDVRNIFLGNRGELLKEDIERRITSKEIDNISGTIKSISSHINELEHLELLHKLAKRRGITIRDPIKDKKIAAYISQEILNNKEFITGHVVKLLYAAKVLKEEGHNGIEIYNKDRSIKTIKFGDDFFYFAIRVCLNYAMGYYNKGSGSDQQTTSQVLQQW